MPDNKIRKRLQEKLAEKRSEQIIKTEIIEAKSVSIDDLIKRDFAIWFEYSEDYKAQHPYKPHHSLWRLWHTEQLLNFPILNIRKFFRDIFKSQFSKTACHNCHQKLFAKIASTAENFDCDLQEYFEEIESRNMFIVYPSFWQKPENLVVLKIILHPKFLEKNPYITNVEIERLVQAETAQNLD